MSARRKQSDSDPLPYVQVDRAVKPKAALLAGALGVTTQHALGSLVEFWDLCGDPRALEAVVEATPDGDEPELVLPRAEIELRFRLASGREATTDTLAAVGLVEPRGDKARVRGMSRYFDPVRRRVQARHAASAGGKARMANAARDESGRVLGAGALAGVSAGESAGHTQPETQPPASRQPADKPSGGQPSASPSGQRSAVSGQIEKKGETQSVPQPLELLPDEPKTRKPPKPPDPSAEFERFKKACTSDELRVFAAYSTAFGVDLGPDWGLLKLVRQKLRAHPADELCAAIRGAGKDPWHRQKGSSLRALFADASTIAQLAKKAAA